MKNPSIENILRFLRPVGPIDLKVHFQPYPAHWRAGRKSPQSDSTFGVELRRQRMALHLFQADLAEAIGVTTVTVSKWERDINLPTRRLRKKLSDYFEQRRNALHKWQYYRTKTQELRTMQ